MTATLSYTTNNSGSRRQAPLPVVHTSTDPERRITGVTNGSTGALGANGSRPPSSSNKGLRKVKAKSSNTSDQQSQFPPSSQNRAAFETDLHGDISDPQISSLPSSSNHGTSIGLQNASENMVNGNNDPFSTPFAGQVVDAKSNEIPPTSAQEAGSVQVLTKDHDEASIKTW
jgi:hypothetical protein